jgi:hypothetical protein
MATMSEGTVAFLGTASGLGVVLAKFGLVDVRVVHHFHVVVGEAALLVPAAVLLAFDTIVPVLVQVASQLRVIVSEITQQTEPTRAVPEHALHKS